MRNQKGFMNMDFTAVFIFLGALCVAVGMFLSWFLQLVWTWVKPFIHALSA